MSKLDLFCIFFLNLPSAYTLHSLLKSEKQTTYNLVVFSYDPVGELVFCDITTDYNVEYQGMLDCLGMDETGLLYGYTLNGPDGNDLYGAFSLLPRYGILRAGIVGGENLFEKESCSQDSPPAAGRFSNTLPLRRNAIPRSVFCVIGQSFL